MSCCATRTSPCTRQKPTGGNGFALFKPYMHTAVAERVRVETGLRTAWLTGDLIVHYQPIVDLANGRMVSIEALARWKHPDGDVIPPDVFIPIAERTGLIIPIGARILNEACQQLASWQQEYGAAADITMSVNVSPRQLYSGDLEAIVEGGNSQRGHRADEPHPRGDRDGRHGRHGQRDPDSRPPQGARCRARDRRLRCGCIVAGEAAPPPRRGGEDRQVARRPRPRRTRRKRVCSTPSSASSARSSCARSSKAWNARTRPSICATPATTLLRGSSTHGPMEAAAIERSLAAARRRRWRSRGVPVETAE